MSLNNKSTFFKKKFDFSIESLLKSDAGKSRYDEPILITNNSNEEKEDQDVHDDFLSPIKDLDKETFSWLNCTRFKPPKLPRSKKRCNLTKRFGRGPRIPFSPYQISILENTFTNSQYLSSENILGLANALSLTETRVKIWFQNRRARFRREKDLLSTSSGSGDLGFIEMTNTKSEQSRKHNNKHIQDQLISQGLEIRSLHTGTEFLTKNKEDFLRDETEGNEREFLEKVHSAESSSPMTPMSQKYRTFFPDESISSFPFKQSSDLNDLTFDSKSYLRKDLLPSFSGNNFMSQIPSHYFTCTYPNISNLIPFPHLYPYSK